MPDIGDALQVRMVADLLGQPIINNLSFSAVAAFGTWEEATVQLYNDLQAAIGPLNAGSVWGANRSDQYVVRAVEILDIYPGTSPLASFGVNGPGGTSEPSMPPNDCLCMTLRSNFRGASGRGRLYLSGYTETDATSGFWEAAAQDAASGIGSAMIEGFGEFAGGASFRWCVLHRQSGGAPVVPPEVKPIMSFTIHNEVRSLGRRAMGRRISRRRSGP